MGKGKVQEVFFLSASGFDQKAINKFTSDKPRIILMTGEDLVFVLNGNISLFDALKAKTDVFVRIGKIYFPLKNI